MLGPFVANTSPAILGEALRSNNTAVWFGALSFEERCAASLIELFNNNLVFTQGFLLRYNTKVEPQYEDIRLRAVNLGTITRLSKRLFKEGLHQIDAEPYSFEALSNLFDKLISETQPSLILCDITCLTKIHALALAVGMQRHSTIQCIVVHSIPENYVITENRTEAIGWKDVIVAPLFSKAGLYNESRSRGIILLGHEADRLIIALSELEPAGGTVLLASTARRPDLRRISQRFNSKVVRHLLRLRSHTWRTEVIDTADFQHLYDTVASEVNLAREYQAPLILFPFGPKPLLFLSALQLAKDYCEASWFVYPVPAAYDINYTEGIQSCIWLIPTDYDSRASSSVGHGE